jgi:predicted nucleic acid-binding protein
MMAIFEQEFNMQTLIDGNIIYDHYMPHTRKKYEIIESLEKHGIKLLFNFLSMSDSFM